jgi:penicillin-binding protein-related factor A (putative recombinase)
MGSDNYFEDDTAKSLRYYAQNHCFAWVRLRDSRSFMKASANILMPKNPCDFIALNRNPAGQSQFYLLESKSSKNHASFPLNNIPEHQITMPESWIYAGALSCFLINNRNNPRKQECFVVPRGIVKNWVAEGIKSVKWEILREQAIQTRRLNNYIGANVALAIPIIIQLQKIPKGDGAWDFSPIFDKPYQSSTKNYQISR